MSVAALAPWIAAHAAFLGVLVFRNVVARWIGV